MLVLRVRMLCIQRALHGLGPEPSLVTMLYHTLSLGLEYTIFSPHGILVWNAEKFCF
jgi:hypothetical protein